VNQGRATLAFLAGTSRRVASSRSRLAKVRALSECLGAVASGDIELAVTYLTGSLPQGRIGIGYRMLQAAAAVAPAREARLLLRDVDDCLSEFGATTGPGSTARRARLLEDLFAAATAEEQEFLRRLLGGELRQGALEGLMLDAIAATTGLPPAKVRRAAMYAPGPGHLAQVALTAGERGLAQFRLRLFEPVAPMLAQTAADVGEALRELPAPVQFEWKMDGVRIQVHKRGGEVRIFTRALNEITEAIPEIVAAVQALPAHEAVLDGEALSFAASGRPHPFQVTMRRFGRRLDVDALRQELPMRAYFFDCLLRDGEELADLPMQQRVCALHAVVAEDARIPHLVTADEAGAQAFLDEALLAGHEGVMAKSLASSYEAGNRGANWLKIKRAHTLDLVVLAAEWGSGRRRGWLSNLHLGAFDPATGEYVMLGKTFKGLTDELLEWQTRELLAREVHRDGITVYVRPELVVEIAFSDLQDSPRYAGGLALRLARVKRYRNDKGPAEADTMDSVRRIRAAQQ
jgi:DNA ligase-1